MPTTFQTNLGPVQLTDRDVPSLPLTFDNTWTEMAYQYSWPPDLGYGWLYVATPGWRERVVPDKPYRVRVTNQAGNPERVVDLVGVQFWQ